MITKRGLTHKRWIKVIDCAKCNKIKPLDLFTRELDRVGKTMYTRLLHQQGSMVIKQIMSTIIVADS